MYGKIPKTEEFRRILYGKTEEFQKLTLLVTEVFELSAMGHPIPPSHPQLPHTLRQTYAQKYIHNCERVKKKLKTKNGVSRKNVIIFAAPEKRGIFFVCVCHIADISSLFFYILLVNICSLWYLLLEFIILFQRALWNLQQNNENFWKKLYLVNNTSNFSVFYIISQQKCAKTPKN